MPLTRLEQQMAFVVEADKLKSVRRQTLLMDRSRHENPAEHSWHLALMAFLLAEHANAPGLDLLKVVRMVILHDLVEIDAGDTFCYDAEGVQDQHLRERRAADRIFGLLPEDQAASFRSAWEEFEAGETPEAQFAAAIDRIQPMLNNLHTGGASWQRHGVRKAQVQERNAGGRAGSTALWAYAERLIEEAVRRGILAE
jgi:putative hydrolase of HD superfamily